MGLIVYTIITFAFYLLYALAIRSFGRWVKDGKYRASFAYNDQIVLTIAIICTVIDVFVTHVLL